MISAATSPLRFDLRCSECGHAGDPAAAACARCGELLEFRLVPGARIDVESWHALLERRRGSTSHLDRSGVWRFRELLPQVDAAHVVTLREGDVPVYEARGGAQYAGAKCVRYLHLGMNPTASFKDAGMTVAISHARSRGARVAVCASTGNTSASMAAYAARAGIVAVVLVPAEGISESKLAQTLDYGARVIAIRGDFDAALSAVRSVDPARFTIVNSINPLRIEGQKTAALVLLEASHWRVPDWVILPGGNLGNSSALGKGFREARTLGITTKIPRIAVVQAEGAAPLVRTFRTGEALRPVVASTTATAIKIGAPASWRKSLREVRESGGTVLAVSDAEIADARAVIGAEGIGCEPASAASLAGLRRLVAEGTVKPDEDVVLVLTGHLLKDTAYAASYHASEARFANAVVHAQNADEARARLQSLENAS
jgi:threonine synthase